jgi:galactokinase
MSGEGASTSRDRKGVDPHARAKGLYCKHFLSPPESIASAPGRVNLIGEHTDYNDGFVLPMGIGLRTCVAIGPSAGGRWHFTSEHQPETIVFERTAVGDTARRDWTSYIRGVIAGFTAVGHEVGPLCVAVASDVPVGSGLSSSAALEVATATALETLLGVSLDPMDKALLCQKAEHEFAGVPCGLMDQVACVFGDIDSSRAGWKPAPLVARLAGSGGAILLDCRTLEVRRVPIDPAWVLVIDSGIGHAHSGGEYAARRLECERAVESLQADGFPVKALRDATPVMLEAIRGDNLLFRRVRHVVNENARTLEAAALLESTAPDRLTRLGQLMNESHASLRDDFEVSTPELDRLVEMACAQPGVHGARMTGGGFGGCVVAIVEPGRAPAIGRVLVETLPGATVRFAY